MKFFIDTANLDQIREAQAIGVLDGVTTNPSLMAKEGITGEKNIIQHYVYFCRNITLYDFTNINIVLKKISFSTMLIFVKS